jgi:hypothetical protein
MIRRRIVKAAALGLILALAPKLVGAQTLDPATGTPGLSEAIRAEAARLASDQARPSGKFENTSQSSSGQRQKARSTNRATYGVAFGFIGLLVGAAIAEKLPGPGPTTDQLMSVAIGGGSGVAIGIWLGGR